jgi:hypothetical protein
LVDTVFEGLVSDESFIETCDFLRSYAIKHDQQYKEKAARQIHNASQSSNRALALIDEIQFQDLCSSDEESATVPPTKNAMVCKLVQIPPEIWMNIHLKDEK